ncbi:MAG: F0F1 ATP synthase subunit gamma, partial [Acidobacteriota bacterium]|nr:F0F1 ATP synthase subunit gamma [Acidobacteriota bacterium]
LEHHIQLKGGPGHDLAVSIAGRVARHFTDGETDAVYLLYSHFRSALSQVPTLDCLLPVATETGADELGDYIYEPDASSLLDRLLLQYVTTLVDRSFLESIASEHGARMTAMDSATSNASDMIDRLTLEMNRARQADHELAVVTASTIRVIHRDEARGALDGAVVEDHGLGLEVDARAPDEDQHQRQSFERTGFPQRSPPRKRG